MTGEVISRDDWLRERQKGIGSSDAAAVCGLSPWRTPLNVYLEKLELAPSNSEEDDSDLLHWGRQLEPVVIEEYKRRTGAQVSNQQQLIRSKEFPFAIATLDGIATFANEGPRILEVKTSQKFSDWGEPGSDSVPVQYIFQCQHQMMCSGYQLADIAVLIRGHDFRIYTIARDEAIIEALLKAEIAFWQCVVTRTPPAPRTGQDALLLYPVPVAGKIVEADEAMFTLHGELIKTKHQLKELAALLDGQETMVKAFMGDAEELKFQGDRLATWKKSKDGRHLVKEKLIKKYPDIYTDEDVSAPTVGARVFLAKDPK